MIGWVKIHREIQNHWIWQNDRYLKWWLTILLNVNHEAKEFPVGTELLVCDQGQSFRSIQQWTDLFSCSKKTTIKFFEMLKNDCMIKCEIVGKGNRRKHLLTVMNWDKFQEWKPECSVNGNPNVPPNKNDKNEKNRERGKKHFSPPTLPEIQSYFSSKIQEKGINLNANVEAEKFETFYSSKNWMIGKNKMTDWKKAVSGWIARTPQPINGHSKPELSKPKPLMR